VEKSRSFTTVDQYIAEFPENTRIVLQHMRELIRSAAPEATEKISYQMPTFFWKGNLVHFAAFKNHIGFYPLPHVLISFEEELKNYKTGKGSVQFPLDTPLPAELIVRMVRFRLEENAAKSLIKKK